MIWTMLVKLQLLSAIRRLIMQSIRKAKHKVDRSVGSGGRVEALSSDHRPRGRVLPNGTGGTETPGGWSWDRLHSNFDFGSGSTANIGGWKCRDHDDGITGSLIVQTPTFFIHTGPYRPLQRLCSVLAKSAASDHATLNERLLY